MCVAVCPLPPIEECNGIDDDCNGFTDDGGALGCTHYYFDQDGDGYGVDGPTQCLCAPDGSYTATVGGDCNDTSGSVNPGMPEICDLVDNDCANGVDDNLINSAPSCPLQLGVCAGSKRPCVFGTWQNCGLTWGYGPHYQTVEANCDGLDNDCDGSIDEATVSSCEDYQDCVDGECQDVGCQDPAKLLNSTCDPEVNTAICNWDAGACCKSTNPVLNCSDCTVMGACECLDPAACENTGLCDCPYLELTGGQYLEINDETDLLDMADGDFTVQFWLRATEDLGPRPLLFWGDQDTTGSCLNRYLQLRVRNDNKVEAWLKGVDGIAHVVSNGPIPSFNGDPDGPWQHVAIVRFKGDKLRVYVNGAKTDTNDAAGDMDLDASSMGPVGHIYIGQLRYECGGDISSNNTFIGDLYKMRFWNHARSHNEIVTEYGIEMFQWETTGMIGRYRFDRGCGDTVLEPGGPMVNASIFANEPASLPTWQITQECVGVESPQ